MILIEDTRQKRNKHSNIHNYCKQVGVEIYPLCLQVGDYMLGCRENGEIKPCGSVSIDTKVDLVEMVNDTIQDELSLNKKYRKCYEQGIKLFVLIEQPFKSLKDIIGWKNPHGKINGRKLYDKLFRLQLMYGITFTFCSREETGKRIIEILTNGLS